MGGTVVSREHQLLGVYVTSSVNRIAAARLSYLDGAAAAGDFPLSNTELFLPGKEVEILAGAGNDPVILFKGIVIRQSLKVRERSAPQLVVECRHPAVKMTVGRRSAYYFEQKDSDIIESLCRGASLQPEVEETAVMHREMVQYDATDWDFLLARAEANGRLVMMRGGALVVKKPVLDGNPVCTLRFGGTILDMDAEIDARRQFDAVKAFTWDPAQQEVVEKEAEDPGVNGPGNLPPGDLAGAIGLDHLRLQSASLTEEEAQAWADARWLQARLSKACGRIRCEGIGTVLPGDLVRLNGVGERFGGTVFVTGVRHDFDTVQGWKTHLQFGVPETGAAEGEPVAAPKAAALLPGVNGLQIGVVTGNEDPEGEDRVRVRLPLVSAEEDGVWARVAAADAGKERGFFFRPEVGDEVVTGFLNDDPRQAVVLGMLHSSAHPAPLKGSDDNHEKLYQSRSKMKLSFHDEKKVLRFETPAGNSVTLSEEDESIRIEDQNGNRIEMTPEGIVIESGKALTLKAGTELKIEAGTSMGIKGGADLKLEGTAGAEISSTATTVIKGALVQIN